MAEIQLWKMVSGSNSYPSSRKFIPVAKTQVADEQEGYINSLTSHWLFDGRYAVRYQKILKGGRMVTKSIRMHQDVADYLGWLGTVDHIEPSETLNNDYRKNLRECPSQSLNNVNKRLDRDSTSGEKNVYLVRGWWVSDFRARGKRIHYARFQFKDEAVKDASAFRLKYYGEFARSK